MNNMCEYFNSVIMLARDKPIIATLDWVMTYLMSRFNVMKERLEKIQGKIMPRPMKRLD